MQKVPRDVALSKQVSGNRLAKNIKSKNVQPHLVGHRNFRSPAERKKGFPDGRRSKEWIIHRQERKGFRRTQIFLKVTPSHQPKELPDMRNSQHAQRLHPYRKGIPCSLTRPTIRLLFTAGASSCGGNYTQNLINLRNHDTPRRNR